MVDHGLTMVNVDHGRPWFDHGQIDGHFMVSSRSCCSGLTMVDHGLTMVNVDHGRPWFDHGQIDGHFMVS